MARDYVELPSQINEHWLQTPEVLNQFALHYKTGKAIPKELVAKIDKASRFNQGFMTTECLASALVDMKLHALREPGDLDPDRYERETLAVLGMPRELPMRHRTPAVFPRCSPARVTRPATTRICGQTRARPRRLGSLRKGQGPLGCRCGEELLRQCAEQRKHAGPGRSFRAFRGRDVDTNALMRDRGFPVSSDYLKIEKRVGRAGFSRFPSIQSSNHRIQSLEDKGLIHMDLRVEILAYHFCQFRPVMDLNKTQQDITIGKIHILQANGTASQIDCSFAACY